MEGLDREWIESGGRRQADYTDMRPGRYAFRVIASNSNGVWNREGTSVEVLIAPPFWFRWWFFILEGILLTGIIITIIRFRERNLKQQARLLAQKVDEKTDEIIEQRKEVDDMKSRFYANISHEFRTPLTLLLGPIEDSLRTGGADIMIRRGVIEVMKRNANRLQRLINQLLDISRLESGKMKVRVAGGDLTGFTRTVSSSFLSMAESKKITYHIELQETGGDCFFDPDKIEKILVNVLSNAFKYTSPGGTVSIHLEYLMHPDNRQPESATFMIQDTGSGIPEQHLTKIFDRFHQVDSQDSRSHEGTGIGLALVKEMVRLYRGEIRVESALGEGSTFSVTLPVGRDKFTEDEITGDLSPRERKQVIDPSYYSEEAGIQEAQKHDADIQDTGMPIILVVEDNPDLRGYISQILFPYYRVLEAENGKSGLMAAAESIPDLVISDLMMPEMDGIEMCEQMKMDHQTSHIPLIMLTAKADRISKLESFGKGADDFILKPFDAEELQARVSNLIEQRKRLRERYRKEFLTDPGTGALPVPADDFLEKVLTRIHKNLSNSEYSVELLGQDVGLSPSQLYRKVVALTDHSPGELIRNSRLKMAAKMFRTGHSNVSTVLYAVGFNTPARFSQYFRELFGVNPSKYIRQKAHSRS